MSRRLTSITIAATLLLSAIPSLADNGPSLTQRQRDERIGGCIMTYGERYRDRCVEIMEGTAAIGRRARHDYEWRRLDGQIEREIRCRDIPGKKSPTDCFFD